MPTLNFSGFSGLHSDIIGCDGPDGNEQIIFAGVVHVSLQQLLNILFRYWTCQHTVFRVPASGHISPADEYYWENGVELDDVCHRVKHLRRNKMWATVNVMLKITLAGLSQFVHSHRLIAVSFPGCTCSCCRWTEFLHCKPSCHDTQPIPRVHCWCWWSSLVPKMPHPNVGHVRDKEGPVQLQAPGYHVLIHFILKEIQYLVHQV